LGTIHIRFTVLTNKKSISIFIYNYIDKSIGRLKSK